VPFDVEPWLGLLHMAIDECQSLVEDGKSGYEEQREEVLASLAAGERTYARPTTFDAVLAGMFPELREVLSREIGTRAYSDRISQEEESSRMKAEDEVRAAEDRALEERKRELAEEAAERERRRLPDAIASVTYQWTWKPNLKVPASAVDAVDYLRFSEHKNAGEQMRALVRDGFCARLEGKDFESWFASRAFMSAEQVMEARDVLEAAWLVQSKLTIKR
jgi:hypothetical protein